MPAATAVIPAPPAETPELPAITAVADSDLVADLVLEPRAAFRARVLDHHRRLKWMGVAVFLWTVPGVLCMVAAQNYTAQVYLSRGHAPGESAASPADVVDALDGSAAVPLRAWLYGLSGGLTTLWTPLWIYRVLRVCDKRAPRGFAAATALLAASGFLVLFVETRWALSTSLRIFSFVFVCAGFAVMSHFAGRRIGFPQMGRVVCLQYFTAAAILILYMLIVPPLFYTTTEPARVFLRLLVHPLMLEAALIVVRYVGRRLPCADTQPMMEYALASYVTLNVIGRLLLFAMRTGAGQLVTVLGLSAVEIWMRVTTLDRDAIYYSVVLGRRRGAAYARTPRAQAVKAECVGADQVSEDASILIAALITIVYRTSGSVDAAPVVASVVASAALQWLAELATDLVPALFVYLASPDFSDADKPAGWLSRRAAGTHRNVARTLIVWRGRSARSSTGVFAGVTALIWGTYVVRFFFNPYELMCTAPGDQPFRGFWHHWVSCSVTES